MAFDSKQFLEDLIKDVNLSDEQKAALQSTLGNSVIAKRLEEGQLRQSDYSRLAGEYQEKVQKATNYYNELTQWKVSEQQRLEAERAALGQPAEPSQPSGQDPAYVSKSEFDAQLQNMQSGAIGLLSVMNDRSIRYFQEFGKPLDTEAVFKRAKDEGTNFLIAYERHIQPEREAKAKVELEARIKKEREDAVKEALANASLPTSQQTQPMGGPVHVLDMIKDKPAGEFGWRAAVKAHTADMAAGTVKHE